MKSSRSKSGKGGAEGRIAFDYIKGQGFRCVHADGAIGAVTPNGHIHMALYSERVAIPRRTVHEVSTSGTVGEMLNDETDTRGSIVREMDVDVFMTVEVAENIVKWLQDRIGQAKEAMLNKSE